MHDIAADRLAQINARAFAHFDDAERFPAFERLAHGGAADLQPLAQHPFGRELVAEPDPGLLYIGGKGIDHSGIKGLALDRAEKAGI